MILAALDALLHDATAGDPVKGTKWTRKTLRTLCAALVAQGFSTTSPMTVRRLLQGRGYRQRVNRKRLTKDHNAHRDRPIRYLTRKRRAFLKAGDPVLSVDTKKKEWVGNFRNEGVTWRQGPLEVMETAFASDAEGKAIPYGLYDVGRNHGFVVVGTAHETAEFAVAAIRRWWQRIGRPVYAEKRQVLIQADSGGANGWRSWLWKAHLQKRADELELTFIVTHYPPGASKWNPVEHRLFCFISMNWAGQPLVSFETVLKFIRTTKTQEGLRCQAWLDTTQYRTGEKVSTQEREQIKLKPHRILPQWNYTIEPHAKNPDK